MKVLAPLLAAITATSQCGDAFMTHHHSRPSTTHLFASQEDVTANSDADEPQEEPASPFALPPIGASSYCDSADNNGMSSTNRANLSEISNGIKISADQVASRKFQLQYTCKICNTRNSIKVTRIAYRKGIVIAKCKGCDNKHLIADNLNWLSGFDYDNGERNIEQFMENRSEESEFANEDLVMRVDKEVFDLESVLYKDQNVGGGGNDVLTSSEKSDNGQEHWG
eukprot:scaffold4601_cov51-Cyclotella_meneghiniana.AAC.3